MHFVSWMDIRMDFFFPLASHPDSRLTPIPSLSRAIGAGLTDQLVASLGKPAKFKRRRRLNATETASRANCQCQCQLPSSLPHPWPSSLFSWHSTTGTGTTRQVALGQSNVICSSPTVLEWRAHTVAQSFGTKDDSLKQNDCCSFFLIK